MARRGIRTVGRPEKLPYKYEEAVDDLKWILGGAQTTVTGTRARLVDADKDVESEIRKAIAELEAQNLRGAIEAIETAIEYSSDSVQVEFLDGTKVDLLKEAAGI